MSVAMHLLMEDVKAFRRACDLSVPTELGIGDRASLSMKLIEEEWNELQDAFAADDIVEVADANR